MHSDRIRHFAVSRFVYDRHSSAPRTVLLRTIHCGIYWCGIYIVFRFQLMVQETFKVRLKSKLGNSG